MHQTMAVPCSRNRQLWLDAYQVRSPSGNADTSSYMAILDGCCCCFKVKNIIQIYFYDWHQWWNSAWNIQSTMKWLTFYRRHFKRHIFHFDLIFTEVFLGLGVSRDNKSILIRVGNSWQAIIWTIKEKFSDVYRLRCADWSGWCKTGPRPLITANINPLRLHHIKHFIIRDVN